MSLFASTRQQLRRWVYWNRFNRERSKHPKCRPCVVIFPSSEASSASSNLRAWLAAPELEHLGWRALVVPEPLSLSQRQRILRQERPDIILLQQTRHPLNQPALYRPYPCILDADDADYLDPRYHDWIVRAATDAAAVIGGSRFVADCLGNHNPHSHVLWTGTPRPKSPPPVPPSERAPVVAWAHATPFSNYTHEERFVRSVMTQVMRRKPCQFWLFGSTEEEASEWLDSLRAAGGGRTSDSADVL